MPSPTELLHRLRSLIKPAGSNCVDDGRSRRFVVVIDCILNQNVRDLGAARFPAMNCGLLEICQQHDIGLLQMPCPEIAVLGFRRARLAGQTIREALDTEVGQAQCAALAGTVADRIDACLDDGGNVLAVLGGNPGSPGCAVHVGEDGLQEASGIFMKALQQELRTRNRDICFKGMRDHDPALLAEDLRWLRDLAAR